MIVFKIWLAWIGFNFAMICLVSLLPSKHICFTGFVVKVPRKYEALLTPNELIAVIQHEYAHKEKFHVWKAFLLRCFFLTPSKKTRIMWELEADNAVQNKKALASALRKISTNSFDLFRADYLETRGL